MMFSLYQAILIFAALTPISSMEIEKIAGSVETIFLKGNITADESKSILMDARESYQTLTDYGNEADPERNKVLLAKFKVFTSQIIDDFSRTDMSLRQLFRNINLYAKDIGNVPSGNESRLNTPMAVVPIILHFLDEKIAEHHSKPLPIRYDVKRILSVQDGSMDNIFRDNEGITPTTVGFFFLEAFATILGLSWGIISMILAGIP